jgi:hypothetical protein
MPEPLAGKQLEQQQQPQQQQEDRRECWNMHSTLCRLRPPVAICLALPSTAAFVRASVDCTSAKDHRPEEAGFQPVRLLVVTASIRFFPSSHESAADAVELTLDKLRLCERGGCCTFTRPR